MIAPATMLTDLEDPNRPIKIALNRDAIRSTGGPRPSRAGSAAGRTTPMTAPTRHAHPGPRHPEPEEGRGAGPAHRPALGAEPQARPADDPHARRVRPDDRRRRGRRHLRRQRPQEGDARRPGPSAAGSSPTTRAWPSTPSDGAPGVYSARYAGAHGDDEANNRKLLDALADVPDDRRGAAFVCALALADPPGAIRLEAAGACRGRIIREPRGAQRVRLRPALPDPRIPQDVRRAERRWSSTSSATAPGPSPGSGPRSTG